VRWKIWSFDPLKLFRGDRQQPTIDEERRLDGRLREIRISHEVDFMAQVVLDTRD
jgi:hypothetical protein